MPAALTEEAKRRLVSNGTYNADGTVNMATAEKAGFAQVWADREAEAKARAAKVVGKPAQSRRTDIRSGRILWNPARQTTALSREDRRFGCS